jgi:molecular chaperone DnaJ
MRKSKLKIIIILAIMIGTLELSYAQTNESSRELKISDEEKIILFTGFSIAVIAIFLFLARDVILRKKTMYDTEEHESKNDRTYEKYHSDWGDDYEEIGKRGNSKQEREFRDHVTNNDLPNYYEILGVKTDAKPEDIKKNFRELAKKTHPDKTKKNSEQEMIKINKAYEILSDKESREKYDRYRKLD